MGGPAAGGALGPELPHLVVLEVGVAERPQGRAFGAEGARERRRCARGTGGAGRAKSFSGRSRGGRAAVSPRVGDLACHACFRKLLQN